MKRWKRPARGHAVRVCSIAAGACAGGTAKCNSKAIGVISTPPVPPGGMRLDETTRDSRYSSIAVERV